MLQLGGECAQNREVCEALEVKHPTTLLGLIVILEANVLEGFQKLTATIVQPVRLTHKRDDHVPRRSFIENHLGVTRNHHLALLLPGGIADHVVNLALADRKSTRLNSSH